VSIIDFLTSLIASVVIFSTLGHSAHLLGVLVDQVTKGGQGLAFVAYPEALSHLPVPHLWSVIFFLMLFLLGLDSEFALFETVTCALFDSFPRLRKHKMMVTSLMCLACPV
jgi:SNF family Na+-dependent transporter